MERQVTIKIGGTCHYSGGEVEEVEVGREDTGDEAGGTDEGPDDCHLATPIAVGQCAGQWSCWQRKRPHVITHAVSIALKKKIN